MAVASRRWNGTFESSVISWRAGEVRGASGVTLAELTCEGGCRR
jgi:hypothetical protein